MSKSKLYDNFLANMEFNGFIDQDALLEMAEGTNNWMNYYKLLKDRVWMI